MCGFIHNCINCSVSLTVHNNKYLRCHYCDFELQMPANCECGASNQCLITKGIGTQQVVKIIKNIFPNANVERADLDTTKNKTRWNKIIEDVRSGQIDIIVGTQSIAKGFDIGNVTLVGIIWAELDFNIAAYNAHEVALQKLIQVAGRSGRSDKEGLVIIQSISNDNLLMFADENKYKNFYEHEILSRQELSYPPFSKFFELEIRNANKNILNSDAEKIKNYLNNAIKGTNAQILGPIDPIVFRIKNINIKKIFIKSKSFGQTHRSIKHLLDNNKLNSSIFVTINPL